MFMFMAGQTFLFIEICNITDNTEVPADSKHMTVYHKL